MFELNVKIFDGEACADNVYKLLLRACNYELHNKDAEFLLRMKRWVEKLENEALCRECFPSGIESLDLIAGLMRAKKTLETYNFDWPRLTGKLKKQEEDFRNSNFTFFKDFPRSGHNCEIGDLLRRVAEISSKHHDCIFNVIDSHEDSVPTLEGLDFDPSWTCESCFPSGPYALAIRFETFKSSLCSLNSSLSDFIRAKAKIGAYREDLHQKLELAMSFYGTILNGNHACKGSEYVRASFQELSYFERRLLDNLYEAW
jgi:hypothetical protein